MVGSDQPQPCVLGYSALTYSLALSYTWDTQVSEAVNKNTSKTNTSKK